MRALLMLVFLLAAGPPQPAPQFFTNERAISIGQPDRQNYFAVDAELWAHARPDLADLRIYAGKREIPYAIATQQGSAQSRESDARVFNVGSTEGATVFTIDTSGASDYNRVTLDLDAQDFITRATVDGFEQPGAAVLRLGTFTIYDFSREQLGKSSTVKLPDSSFRYLRVNLPGILPRQLRGARVSYYQETKTIWTELPVRPNIIQSGARTVIAWEQPKNAPLDRIVLAVDPRHLNFRRSIALQDGAGQTIGRGQVSRIHLERGGKVVDSEDLALVVPGVRSPSYRLLIENGDDPALDVTGLRALSVERRVYLDPHGESSLQLYYGDPELGPPTYDFAKLFQQDPAAVVALLGPGVHNAAYTGRPDERPWSERHVIVLWTVLVIAVVGLGAVALRSLRA